MTLLEVSALYLALLEHPHDKWRIENQMAYCVVRDDIAQRLGIDAEIVQNTFEQGVLAALAEKAA